jgi:hypothetical protein
MIYIIISNATAINKVNDIKTKFSKANNKKKKK